MKKKYKVVQTGGSEKDKDFMFKHIILSTEQYKNIIDQGTDIKKLAEEYEVDFISVLKNEKTNFLHISSPDNEKSIDNTGLVVKENDFVLDLGNGIYAIKDTKDATYPGLDNLQTYVTEGYDYDAKLLIVQGYYTGEYLECVYGYQHEGYIVLLNDISDKDIWNLEIQTIDGFLLQ